MFGLDLEEQDTMDWVLGAALPMWSAREYQCFILQLLGYTQAQSAQMLGIAQKNVCIYLGRAMEKVREASKSCV